MENLTPVRPASIIGNSRLKEIKTIKGVANNLLSQKKQNFDLEKKFFKIQKDNIAKNKLREKEKLQEMKKPAKKAGFVREELKDKSIKLYDLFKFFVGYKVLQWMSRKENIEAIGEIAKAMKNIFKIIDHLAGIGVEGVLGGLHSVLFGSNFLERFFGIFKLIGGFFIIRRLLFPGQILKDINWILKNRKSIGKVFKALGSGKLKEAIGRIFKLLNPTLYTAYTKGLTAGIKRVVLKVFGKNTLKLLTKVASKIGFRSAKEFVKKSAQSIAKPLTKIPFIGPILGFGLNLIFGDPLDKAVVKAIGASIGAWLGGITMGALGSIVPIAGTAAGAGFGAVVGGFIGDWVGDKLYGFFKGFTAPKEPALAVGGIVTKPTRALIGEAGPEAVIPLPKIYDGTILNAPMSIVASSMIGGIDAVISSLGPIGLTIRPYASSLLSPYRREFGSTNYVFTSNVGGSTTGVATKLPTETNDNEEVAKILGLNKTVNLIKKKEASEEAKKSRYNSGNSIREILGDILNNIINLDFTSPGGPGGPGGSTGTVEDTTGEVEPSDYPKSNDEAFKKIFDIAVKLGDPVPELTAAQAMFESGWLKSPKARLDNNPFGQTGSGTAGKVWSNGRWWARYKTYDDAVKSRIGRWANGTPAGGPGYASKGGAPIPGLLTILETYAPGSENDHSSYISSVKRILVSYGFDPNKKNSPNQLKMQQGGLVSRGDVTSKFGNKESFRKNAHEGIDIAFPSGTPLSFNLGGKFIKIARTSSTEKEANGGYGQYMDVKLTDGKIARLAHLSSIPNWVKQGSEFAPNAVIALSGGIPKAPGSGRSGGPHLHLEQHTTQKDLAETLNGKVDPLSQGLFSLLRKGGAPGSATNGPAQPSQAPATSPDTVPESEEADSSSAFNPESIAKNLGELFQMLTGTPNTSGAQLQKDSMDYVQAFKDFKPNPDTYIMAGGTNIFSSTTMLTPISQPDYSVGSFSSIDSATAFNLKTRL